MNIKLKIAEYMAALDTDAAIDFCNKNELDFSNVLMADLTTPESIGDCLFTFLQNGIWLGYLISKSDVWSEFLKFITEERYHSALDLVSDSPILTIYYLRGCYRLGFPALSDKEFDFIEDIYIKTFPALSFFNEQTYDDDEYPSIVQDALKISRVKRDRINTMSLQSTSDNIGFSEYASLNREKSTSIKPVVDPKEAFEFWCNAPKCRVHFSLKIDGINTKIGFGEVYGDGLKVAMSRGRASNSLDYTESVRTYLRSKDIDDKNITGRVTGESCVLLNDLKIIQAHYPDKDYKTPKSTAMAMLRAPASFSESDLGLLTVFAFSYDDRLPDVAFKQLQEFGFRVPPYLEFDGDDIPRTSLQDFNTWMDTNVLQPLNKMGEEVGVGSDGVVMYLLADINTERKDKYSDSNIAIKYGPWAAKEYKSRVTNIIIEQKRVKASIVLVIEPVATRDMNMATRVGIGSPDILMRDNVRVGDIIVFERKSEAYNVYLRKEG